MTILRRGPIQKIADGGGRGDFTPNSVTLEQEGWVISRWTYRPTRSWSWLVRNALKKRVQLVLGAVRHVWDYR